MDYITNIRFRESLEKLDDLELKEFQTKLISELHDIALSLRVMSGRNVVKTNEPPKKEGYIEKYFKRSEEDIRDENSL